MNKYTKVNVRKDLVEKIKIKAAADNRSIANYIETLILNDLAPPIT
jgi:hypothetical protein